MEDIFVLQKEYLEDKYDVEGIIYHQLLSLYTPRNLDKFIVSSINEIEEVQLEYKSKGIDVEKNVIPIGNLNYIRKWLSSLFKVTDVSMKPIEVPEVLYQFLERDYFIITGKDLIDSNIDLRYKFVKDVDVLKRWNSLLYKGYDIRHLVQENVHYVVTDYVDIISEYRVFVHRDSILACKYYSGDVLIFPDADRIKDMVKVYEKDKTRPISYTLDIAVIKVDNNYVTVPLEVHTFVSCGLYGFYDEDILYMLKQGYQYYVEENKKS